MKKVFKKINKGVSIFLAFVMICSMPYFFNIFINIVMIPDDALGDTISDDVEINEVNFPDEIFRNYVLDKRDTDKNGFLSKNEIEKTGTVNVKNMGITSLKGIEYFTKMINFFCDNNDLTELDLSKNAEIKSFSCGNNPIKSLNLKNNTELQYLTCINCALTDLDVSSNINLIHIDCQNKKEGKYENSISSLDISKNKNLLRLYCNGIMLENLNIKGAEKLDQIFLNDNNIESLDLSENKSITYINCNNNPLSNIDVSKNIQLSNLQFNNCNISEIDISNNSKLEVLKCNNNNLYKLDLRENESLRWLECSNNHLTSVDLSNTSINPDIEMDVSLVFKCNDNKFNAEGCILNFKDMPGEFDKNKTDNWTEALVNDNEKLICKGRGNNMEAVKYTYDCGNGYTAEFSINFSDEAHSYTKIEEISADCETPGNIEYYHCSQCGYNFVDSSLSTITDNTEIEATGHQWGEWKKEKIPTLTENGTLKRICINNNIHTESRDIPSLSDERVWTKDESKHIDSTEYNEGQDVYKSDEYGEVIVKIPKNEAHSHNYADGKCTVCGEIDPNHEHNYKDGICTICGHKGNIIHNVKSGDNAPETEIVTSKKEFENIILSEDEKNSAERGTNIEILLMIDNVDESVDKSDKDIINEKLKTSPELKNFVVGQYLDINLFKIIGKDKSKISETKSKIKVCITIPDKFKDIKNTTEFSVMRIHNGESEKLDDIDDNKDTITIETDRFSTYVIVYESTSDINTDNTDKDDTDTDNTGKDDTNTDNIGKDDTNTDNTGKGDANTDNTGMGDINMENTDKNIDTKGNYNAVNTGDGALTAVYVIIAVFAVVSCCTLFMKNNRCRLNKK